MQEEGSSARDGIVRIARWTRGAIRDLAELAPTRTKRERRKGDNGTTNRRSTTTPGRGFGCCSRHAARPVISSKQQSPPQVNRIRFIGDLRIARGTYLGATLRTLAMGNFDYDPSRLHMTSPWIAAPSSTDVFSASPQLAAQAQFYLRRDL